MAKKVFWFQKQKSKDEDEPWPENEWDDFNSIPEGCAACGGDYPNCTSSCPLYDE